MIDDELIARPYFRQILRWLLLAAEGDEEALDQLKLFTTILTGGADDTAARILGASLLRDSGQAVDGAELWPLGGLQSRDLRLGKALLTIAKALAKKHPRRGRKPTRRWQSEVAMTALILERCCGREAAEAKACAAERWGRNLRSVQRYAAENRRVNVAVLEAMRAIAPVASLNWQGMARRSRLQDDEARQFIDYLLSRQKVVRLKS
jgi:hypothetical protein